MSSNFHFNCDSHTKAISNLRLISFCSWKFTKFTFLLRRFYCLQHLFLHFFSFLSLHTSHSLGTLRINEYSVTSRCYKECELKRTEMLGKSSHWTNAFRALLDTAVNHHWTHCTLFGSVKLLELVLFTDKRVERNLYVHRSALDSVFDKKFEIQNFWMFSNSFEFCCLLKNWK